MEPETMPYDADATACQEWQVPARSEPVPAAGFLPSSISLDLDAAAAPTLVYDTAGEMADDLLGDMAGDVSGNPVAPTLRYEETLAYEEESPGGRMPQADLGVSAHVSGGSASNMPSEATIALEEDELALAPTITYGDDSFVFEAAAATADAASSRQDPGPSLGSPVTVRSAAAAHAPSPSPSPALLMPPPPVPQSPARAKVTLRQCQGEMPSSKQVLLRFSGSGEAQGKAKSEGTLSDLSRAEASDLPRPVLASEAASSSGSSSSSRPRRQREDDVEDSAGTAINIGSQVRVKGDGWGGGFGEYDGTVTEQDELSLTVIFKSVETKKWEETQVLREHCQPITDAEETPAQRQRTS
ncbi:unnamed protein product [Polarella glacialis]|uniref:Uncharacterized protein n=1 Tax=Polarella glacialis TaxID=89957 RepID=A0A813G6T9_POLGL|nr:unnamed protein product [Polarella glacialis]